MGIADIVNVVNTGDCVPGIILKDTLEEFIEYLNSDYLIYQKDRVIIKYFRD